MSIERTEGVKMPQTAPGERDSLVIFLAQVNIKFHGSGTDRKILSVNASSCKAGCASANGRISRTLVGLSGDALIAAA
jgi:hypothetical protein